MNRKAALEIYEIQKAALVTRYSSYTEEGEVGDEEEEKPKAVSKPPEGKKDYKEPPVKGEKAAVHKHEVDPEEVEKKTVPEEVVPEVIPEEEDNGTEEGGDA
jgi:hypothetical protein